MDRFSGVNSARRLNQVVDEWAKQRREAEAVVRERQKRSEELENAQMGSAEDIRKMLEMMEANQKEQAAEIQKNLGFFLSSIWFASLCVSCSCGIMKTQEEIEI